MTELEEADKAVAEARRKADEIDAALTNFTTAHVAAWKEFDRCYWVWEKLRREARNGA